jgi:predicted secreted protein
MAHGEVNVQKGRDQALLVAKTLGVAPTNEVTGTVEMVGDTQFEFAGKNNFANEDCRGAKNLIAINGSSENSISVAHSGLLNDEAYVSLKRAYATKAQVWAGKKTPGGLDWNGMWIVSDLKETVGLDESVKTTFTLNAAGTIELPEELRPLKTGA